MTCISVCSDFSQIAIGTKEGLVLLYDTKKKTFKVCSPLKAKRAITCIEFNGDLVHLVAGSLDGSVFYIRVGKDRLELLQSFNQLVSEPIVNLIFYDDLSVFFLTVGQMGHQIVCKSSTDKKKKPKLEVY